MSHDNFEDEEFDSEDDNELDELLNADAKEEPQEPVNLPESRPGLSWTPAGAGFRAELADTEKMFSVNGKMIPESQLQAAQEDPELYTFLFERQKAGLEPDPDGLRIVGGDPRNPDIDELESVIGRICPFCGQSIEEGEITVSDMGSLVFYGPDIWHWEHLALQALLVCRGHYKQASERFHLPEQDLRAMRTLELRSLSWGRLGYVRGGQ